MFNIFFFLNLITFYGIIDVIISLSYRFQEYPIAGIGIVDGGAHAAVNGKEVDGRVLTVNEARPKPAGGFRGGKRTILFRSFTLGNKYI